MPRAERGLPKRTLHQHFWLLHVCLQRGLSFRQQRGPMWRQERVLGKWGQSLRRGRFVRQHRRQFWVLLSGKLLPCLHCHFSLVTFLRHILPVIQTTIHPVSDLMISIFVPMLWVNCFFSLVTSCHRMGRAASTCVKNPVSSTLKEAPVPSQCLARRPAQFAAAQWVPGKVKSCPLPPIKFTITYSVS